MRREIRRLNAVSGVLDLEHQLVLVAPEPTGELAAGRHRLDGVAQEIEQDLLHLRPLTGLRGESRFSQANSIRAGSISALMRSRTSSRLEEVGHLVRIFHPEFDQQVLDESLDLLEGPFPSAAYSARQVPGRWLGTQSAQAIQHSREGVVDLVGNAGGDAAQSHHLFVGRQLAFQLSLLVELGRHPVEAVDQLSDFIAAGDRQGWSPRVRVPPSSAKVSAMAAMCGSTRLPPERCRPTPCRRTEKGPSISASRLFLVHLAR